MAEVTKVHKDYLKRVSKPELNPVNMKYEQDIEDTEEFEPGNWAPVIISSKSGKVVEQPFISYEEMLAKLKN